MILGYALRERLKTLNSVLCGCRMQHSGIQLESLFLKLCSSVIFFTSNYIGQLDICIIVLCIIYNGLDRSSKQHIIRVASL